MKQVTPVTPMNDALSSLQALASELKPVKHWVIPPTRHAALHQCLDEVEECLDSRYVRCGDCGERMCEQEVLTHVCGGRFCRVQCGDCGVFVDGDRVDSHVCGVIPAPPPLCPIADEPMEDVDAGPSSPLGWTRSAPKVRRQTSAPFTLDDVHSRLELLRLELSLAMPGAADAPPLPWWELTTPDAYEQLSAAIGSVRAVLDEQFLKCGDCFELIRADDIHSHVCSQVCSLCMWGGEQKARRPSPPLTAPFSGVGVTAGDEPFDCSDGCARCGRALDEYLATSLGGGRVGGAGEAELPGGLGGEGEGGGGDGGGGARGSEGGSGASGLAGQLAHSLADTGFMRRVHASMRVALDRGKAAAGLGGSSRAGTTLGGDAPHGSADGDARVLGACAPTSPARPPQGAVATGSEPQAVPKRRAWNAQEDAAICSLVATHGQDFERVASALPGRTAHAVRNRWGRLKGGGKLPDLVKGHSYRCAHCGAPKRGHRCVQAGAAARGTKTQRARSESYRDAASEVSEVSTTSEIASEITSEAISEIELVAGIDCAADIPSLATADAAAARDGDAAAGGGAGGGLDLAEVRRFLEGRAGDEGAAQANPPLIDLHHLAELVDLAWEEDGAQPPRVPFLCPPES